MLLSLDPVLISCSIYRLALPKILWVEWLVCVPFLSFLTTAVNGKLARSRGHWTIMISLFATILFGYIANIVRDYYMALLFFTLSCTAFSYCMVGSYQFKMYVTQLPVAPSTYDLQTAALDELQFYTAINNVRILVVFVMPSFPIIYIFGMLHWIDIATVWKAFVVANVVSKLGYLSVVCDAQIQLVDAKATTKAAISSAIATKAEVLRYVFHEIRNPLNSLSVGLDLISHSANLCSVDVKALSLMNESTNYMTDTLNNVLYIQMIDDGALTLNNRPLSLTQLFYDVKSSLSSRSENLDVHIVISFDATTPTIVVGDRHQLQLAFTNIISQLMNFCKKSSALTVKISTEAQDEAKATALPRRVESSVSLSPTNKSPLHSVKSVGAASMAEINLKRYYIMFHDDGPGISDEDLAMLLQPFNRLRGSDSSSGLGLTLARAIIEIHGGEILKHKINDSNGSSRISISIPFEISSEQHIHPSQESSEISSEVDHYSNEISIDDHDLRSIDEHEENFELNHQENDHNNVIEDNISNMNPVLDSNAVHLLSSLSAYHRNQSPEKMQSGNLYPNRLNLFVPKTKSSGSMSNTSSGARLSAGLALHAINVALIVDGKTIILFLKLMLIIETASSVCRC